MVLIWIFLLRVQVLSAEFLTVRVMVFGPAEVNLTLEMFWAVEDAGVAPSKVQDQDLRDVPLGVRVWSKKLVIPLAVGEVGSQTKLQVKTSMFLTVNF